MRIASVLTPLSDYHLRLASQVGVTDIVGRYPGQDLGELVALRDRIASFGMRLSVIEGYLPIENIKLGTPQRDDEMRQMKILVRNMGQAGIPLLCYNFMAGSDWSRTTFTAKDRGGALVSGFRLEDVERLPAPPALSITPDDLWKNLDRFLRELLPVAEEAGVTLAMHPDDPPLALVRGMPRIMHTVESFERLMEMSPSDRHAICFCQGTFAEMGVDIPATIRRLGRRIRYVHFRDIRGVASDFVETFHDNGQTDMAAAIRAYRDVGFDGPMRPDHVPQLAGEEDGDPGYTMLGRLYAVGYMRGLMHASGQ